MSQCVPSWGLDDSPPPANLALLRSNSLATNVPSLDYEVAELTWENGQLAMHGLGHKPTSPTTKYTWDNKPSGGGTLESIVDQATHHHRKSAADGSSDELVPWLDNRHAKIKTAAATDASVGNNKIIITADALVPCSNNTGNYSDQRDGNGTCYVASSTYVGSCSGAVNGRTARAETGAAHEWSSMAADQSVSGSATTCGGRDSRQLTVEYSSERDLGSGRFTSTSMGSPENTSSAKTVDDHDSVCRKRSQRDQAGNEEDKKKRCKKSSVSTKRSRAAATHNQSERKRRDKINQKMKTLQKMVPNSSKTDKASMLDEVIEYLKQLQAQVEMMNRMNMSPMMMPNMAMQQQLQMLMMAPMGMRLGMGMGMGMGGGMDMNNLGCHNITGMPPFLHPNTAAFMPMTSWDRSGDRISSAAPADPLAAFLACQSQPMTMDAYSRMAALYQHFLQPPTTGHGPKN